MIFRVDVLELPARAGPCSFVDIDPHVKSVGLPVAGRRVVAALLVAALCGCATPYDPQSLASGFKETKLADNRYQVTFKGNANTDEEKVVNYWLYRCAELTTQNGYSYFRLLPEGGRPLSNIQSGGVNEQASSGSGSGEPNMMKVKGGRTIVIPGSTTTVTTWNKQGTIEMFRTRPEGVSTRTLALHAPTVIDRLGEYVRSGGKIKAPPRGEVVEAALRYTPNQEMGGAPATSPLR
jgi:hypothetical protein